MIAITDQLWIPDDELEFRVSRSSGPGGQHVNKTNSRVTLLFDVAGSPTLSDAQKFRIAKRLGSRMTLAGVLLLHAQRHRSQAANRRDLLERFAELLRDALKEETPRRPTRRTKASKRRRLDTKRRRGETKRLRGTPRGDD